MYEDEGGFFADDKNLDDLRWFIYPKECAEWLKEGKDHVPGTYSMHLIGGIRPLGYFSNPTINNKIFEANVVTEVLTNDIDKEKEFYLEIKLSAEDVLAHEPDLTPLLTMAAARGLQTRNGLGMNLDQAVIAFGKAVPGALGMDAVRAAMRAA